jgi:hypothetical protein
MIDPREECKLELIIVRTGMQIPYHIDATCSVNGQYVMNVQGTSLAELFVNAANYLRQPVAKTLWLDKSGASK